MPLTLYGSLSFSDWLNHALLCLYAGVLDFCLCLHTCLNTALWFANCSIQTWPSFPTRSQTVSAWHIWGGPVSRICSWNMSAKRVPQGPHICVNQKDMLAWSTMTAILSPINSVDFCMSCLVDWCREREVSEKVSAMKCTGEDNRCSLSLSLSLYLYRLVSRKICMYVCMYV